MPKRSRRHVQLTPKETASSAAAIAMFLGFLVFYFLAEAILNSRIHPLHWLAGGIGAAVSWAIAYGVVYWRRLHPYG